MPASAAALSTELTNAIESTLTAFLTGEIDALYDIDPAMGGFGRIAGDCVLAGGKRLRPTFAYWGWRGVVGQQDFPGPILPALASLELLHTFALVHDDVMDASATRRGRPTAHRTLAAQHSAAGQTGDAERFGEAGAILVGDLCLIWADRMLAHSALPANTLLDARRCYDQMRVDTVAGQYLDVFGETDARNWSVERALRVARYKTASYTVQRPLLFGAALAGLGRDVSLNSAYSRYGLAVGEAFQLCDDLLGVYGDPVTTGKPAGDDLRNGKPTVLLMLARELATDAQRAELDRELARTATVGADPAGLPSARTGPDSGADPDRPDAPDRPHAPGRAPGQPRLSDRAVANLAELVVETGAVHRVEEMIAERVAEALTALDAAPIDPAARVALTDLAVAATKRRA